jgi:ABC transporter DrrB family efflux protein
MLLRQFLMEWTLYSRDRVAMFWTFLFPLLMLLGFGVIFQAQGPSLTLVWSMPAQVSATDTELAQALAHTPLKLLRLPQAEAEARWQRGETAAQIEKDRDGYRIRVNSYLLSQGESAAQIAQEAHLLAEAQHNGVQINLLPVLVESPGHAHATNYAAFLLPGLIGLNLLSMGLFSVGMVNVAYREKGKFRRLAVTPLPKWIFLAGQILHRLTVVFLQSVVMLLAGWLVFGITNQGSYLALLAVITLGTGCFMAMGFALSSFAQTTETYGAISNVFFFPMMFLSGVYFTLDSAPKWLQASVVVLPLSPYIKALRAVFNDGSGLAAHVGGLAVVAVWTLLAFGLAVKRFKWT